MVYTFRPGANGFDFVGATATCTECGNTWMLELNDDGVMELGPDCAQCQRQTVIGVTDGAY